MPTLDNKYSELSAMMSEAFRDIAHPTELFDYFREPELTPPSGISSNNNPECLLYVITANLIKSPRLRFIDSFFIDASDIAKRTDSGESLTSIMTLLNVKLTEDMKTFIANALDAARKLK